MVLIMNINNIKEIKNIDIVTLKNDDAVSIIENELFPCLTLDLLWNRDSRVKKNILSWIFSKWNNSDYFHDEKSDVKFDDCPIEVINNFHAEERVIAFENCPIKVINDFHAEESCVAFDDCAIKVSNTGNKLKDSANAFLDFLACYSSVTEFDEELSYPITPDLYNERLRDTIEFVVHQYCVQFFENNFSQLTEIEIEELIAFNSLVSKKIGTVSSQIFTHLLDQCSDWKLEDFSSSH